MTCSLSGTFIMAVPKPSRSTFSLGGSSHPEPIHPVRRASEFDINYPPRYSTLVAPSNPVATHNDPVIPTGPPAYTSVFQRPQSVEPVERRPCAVRPLQIQRQRPQPDPRNGTHSHHYHIIGSKTEPWATLKVYSPSSSHIDRQNTPYYTTDDPIRGVLELNLDTPQNISSIFLSLRGRITSSSYGDGSYTFLELPITSWDRNDGDPRSMFFTSETIIKKFEGKLSGQYSWPFHLAFPKEVTIRGQHQYLSKTYPTPRSFVESETKISVQYDLVLRITHGMLRADSKLNVEVTYAPDSTPDPFSPLCDAAYSRHLSVPGPDEDPDGWYTLSHANIHGKLCSNGRHAHLRCTLSLAKPQCYSRGSVIPCHLSIHSKNTDALDTLANHEYLRVCLVRRIHLHEDPKQAYSRTQEVKNTNGDRVPPGVIEKLDVIERAVWWPISSADEPDTRYLQGEIHLDEELQPSSQFLLFKVSYAIELYPFESRLFKCTNSGFNADNVNTRIPKAFMTHPVTIASKQRPGPTPVPCTVVKPHFRRIDPAPEFVFCAVR